MGGKIELVKGPPRTEPCSKGCRHPMCVAVSIKQEVKDGERTGTGKDEEARNSPV